MDTAGALGNSDVHLALAPDGTVYFASMTFDGAAGEGRRVAVAASPDAGVTWSWRVLARRRFDDRPWVAVAPDGTAHAIWNEDGVWHSVSRDRGATWSAPARVTERGGSSDLAVGPNGEVAVRVSPSSASGVRLDRDVDLVAVSTDGGATWQSHAPPARRRWTTLDSADTIPKWVEPLGWDAVGRLYALWTDTSGVWLARSADRAATWTRWRLSDGVPCYYPYLAARGDGDLAATWMCGHKETLRWRAARVSLGTSGAPRVALSPPLELDAWDADSATGYVPYRDPAGEYVGVTFLRDGSIGVVTPVQHPARIGFTWWRLR